MRGGGAVGGYTPAIATDHPDLKATPQARWQASAVAVSSSSPARAQTSTPARSHGSMAPRSPPRSAAKQKKKKKKKTNVVVVKRGDQLRQQTAPSSPSRSPPVRWMVT